MSLWKIEAGVSTSHGFTTIVPEEVLAEYDGLLSFTFRDGAGGLRLAHLCADGPGVSRYLVCTTDEASVGLLKGGVIPIRSVLLSRPPLLLVDIRPDGSIAGVWPTSVNELPEGAIPAPDVLLTAG